MIAATDPLKGRRLGDFVVLEKIGEGGFGAVYRAEQALLGREAVIKVIRGRRRLDAEATQRFLREARLASQLDHPYAAHLYAFGVEPDGLMWMAMELVRGTPLDQLLALQGPLALDRLVPLVDRICEVVHTAHEQGIVHRDLKPANVMVIVRAGRLLPKLLDFGIAKAIDAPTEATSVPGDGPVDVELTQRGALIGSPQYMAPEQWVQGAVGPRADLYALGVLIYRALTGRLPFDAETVIGLAKLHGRAPVPPVGARFPAAIDEVLQKAMAKRADDRYDDALMLGRAFRSAAGLADEQPPPRLEGQTAADVIAEGPAPIADAVAAVQAARSLHQALAEVQSTFAALVRFVGLVALSARGKIGAGQAQDPQALVELLRAARRRPLRPDEWLTLAVELTQPFVDRRDAHPVPELVSLFASRTLPAPFEALLTIADATEHAVPAAEADVRGLLSLALQALEGALRAVAFFAEYPLALATGDRVERWSGLRRGRRELLATRGPTLRPGRPTLLSVDGAPVLELWPLVQVAAPTPGSPEEMFLFEGPGRSGAQLVSWPDGFKRTDPELWTWFGERVLAGDEAGQTTPVDERSPFRGLSSFTVADQAVFFGREREVEALINRLQLHPLIAIVGPSGAGKSSFVQAGVLPGLPEGWSTRTMRPGTNPERELVAALATLPERGVRLLVVDQLEELFTLCGDASERARFGERLVAAVGDPAHETRVVLTLRDDFLVRAEELPALRDRIAVGLQLLTTPTADQLQRMITEPARHVGYDFDDRTLPARMVEDVLGQPGALALLSFAATQMWELRDRQFKQLTAKTYAAMDGVVGALAQHADAVLAALGDEEQRLVREAFRHLVTSDGTRAVLTRAELLELLGGGARAQAVVESLIAARLLVSGERAGGIVQIEVIHEALLGAWPRLVGWRREDAEGARLRDQLRQAARQWQDRGRDHGLLWRGDALAELQLWRSRHAPSLTEAEAAFARSSVDDASRGARARRRALAGVITGLVAAVLTVTVFAVRARRAAEQIREALAESNAERGRREWLDGDPRAALLYLEAARASGRDDDAMRFLVARAQAALLPLRMTLIGHHGAVNKINLSRDRKHLLSCSDDGTARIWDLESGRSLLELAGHVGTVLNALFTPDGAQALTVGVDGTLRTWDARDGHVLGTARLAAEIARARVAPDGRHVVFSDSQGVVAIWSTAHARRVAVLPHPAAITSIHFDEHDRVLTSCDDGVARLWRLQDGLLVTSMRGHRGAVEYADLSYDGTQVVTAGRDATVRLWDAASGALLRTISGHAGPVHYVELSHDGGRIASSAERTAYVWDATTGEPVRRFDRHKSNVLETMFSPDGTRLLTTADDGIARVWDIARGGLDVALVGHEATVHVQEFDGDRAITRGLDGTVRVWDTRQRAVERSLHGHKGEVRGVQFSPSGDELHSVSLDGTMRTWHLDRGEVESRRFAPAEVATATPTRSADLAIIANGVDASLWDFGSGAERWKDAPRASPLSSASVSERAGVAVTCAMDDVVRVLRLADGQLLRSVTLPEPPMSCTLSDGGQLLAIGSQSGVVRILDVGSGALRQLPGKHGSDVFDLAFSGDARLLVSVSADRTAKLWSPDSAGEIGVLLGHPAELDGVAISRDGALIVTASADGNLEVWDREQGRLLDDFVAHAGAALAVAFDPSGRRIASGGADGVVRVWTLPRPPIAAAALTAFVRCRVPFSLANGRLVARPLDIARCAQ